MEEKKFLVVSGKRKTSVARVKIIGGEGLITYNKIPYDKLKIFHKLTLIEPVRIFEKVIGKPNFNININVKGGGKESQIQAARLGIAKALLGVTKSKELRDAFIKYDRYLLVADDRRKEQRKPGDSKARAKRQKSYR